MESFPVRVRSKLRKPLLLLVAAVVVALGAALWIGTTRTSSHLAMPSTGIVAITGYGSSSPMNPSTRPLSVVLTGSQAAALQKSISEIPTLPQSAGPVICMENETVFRITVKGAPNSARATWVAQAVRCPAPGVLYVHGDGVGRPEAGRYCTLKTLLISFFPKGAANATRKELRSC
jgi:hypothetical protein